MLASIRQFTRALLTPDLSFATLADARVVCGPDGLPLLHRTTRFAEAQIEWQGQRWILSLPLHPSAMHRIERLANQLRTIGSPALTEYRILPREMCWEDAHNQVFTSDLILQSTPSGGGFSEALIHERGATLLAALDALEAELRRVGFVHRNLKPNNLIWHNGRLYPLRYHDACIGSPDASDAAAFEALRELVRTTTGCSELHDAAAAYDAAPRLEGHRWTGNPFEGLICVEDDAGFGYVDTENRPVIPSQFAWAGDFHEGRAEVQTAEGTMGLIDRNGTYILPPIYEIVDYDPATSRIRCRLDGRWAEFDYTGRQLTEFGTEYEV